MQIDQINKGLKFKRTIYSAPDRLQCIGTCVNGLKRYKQGEDLDLSDPIDLIT